MAGDISHLTALGSTLSRIGDDHVGQNSKNEIVKGSSSPLGRTVNWIKSWLGLGGGSTKAAMKSVITTIRSTEGMGDRFAEIAEGPPGQRVDSGHAHHRARGLQGHQRSGALQE